MNVAQMAARAYELMHELRSCATNYSSRKDDGRATAQKEKMLRRRIIQMREWLQIIEDALNRGEA
jgi:hypothetical protein